MEANRTAGVSLRTRALAFSLRHAPRLTESIANHVGRVMTSKIGRRVASGVLGREYDLLGARTRADCFNIARAANPSDDLSSTYHSILGSKGFRAQILRNSWHGRRINNDRELLGPQNGDTDNLYDPTDLSTTYSRLRQPRDLGGPGQERQSQERQSQERQSYDYGVTPNRGYDRAILGWNWGYLLRRVLRTERTGWNPTDPPEPPQKK